MSTRQDTIDQLEGRFHEAVGELDDATRFAHSDESEGDTIGAFGKVVTLAREVVRLDDELKKHGQSHEELPDMSNAVPSIAPIVPQSMQHGDSDTVYTQIEKLSDVSMALRHAEKTESDTCPELQEELNDELANLVRVAVGFDMVQAHYQAGRFDQETADRIVDAQKVSVIKLASLDQ